VSRALDIYDKEDNEMKMLIRFTTIVMTSLASSYINPVLASEFTNPPEGVAPDWRTDFPYRRNLEWDFDRDPTITPPAGHFNDATYDIHYEGTDDPVLWLLDYAEFEGPVQWFSDLGVIGIDNTSGLLDTEGFAVFHIGDSAPSLPVKHLWAELASLQPMPFQDLVVPDLWVPNDANWSWQSWQYYDGIAPAVLELDWWQIKPDTAWQDVVLWIQAPAGMAVYVDSFHIAVESVPEPASLILLALGGIAFAPIRSRRL